MINKYYKQTVRSIKNQFIGNKKNKIKFFSAFYSHYILKKIGLKSFIDFPAAQFKFQDIILKTRPKTIDFWACLETYEPDLTFFLKEVLTRKGSFVDVGAHIGRFSVLMAKQGWKVYSFEPVGINFKALEDNLKLNNAYENAKIFNVGLGDNNEQKDIHYDRMAMGEASVYKNERSNESVSVKIVRFDFLFKDYTEFIEPCLLKVDVEGFEQKVISGMKDFIKEKKPLLILELWKEQSAELIQFLKSEGYERLHIFWFIRSKHIKEIEEMNKFYKKHNVKYQYE